MGYVIFQMSGEPVERRQLRPLARRMDHPQGRAEGNHVQVAEFLAEQAAFQSGMDGFDFGILPEQFPVGVRADLQDPGYAEACTTSAPASEKMAATFAAIISRAEPLALRWLVTTFTVPPCIRTEARFVDVSTRPGMS